MRCKGPIFLPLKCKLRFCDTDKVMKFKSCWDQKYVSIRKTEILPSVLPLICEVLCKSVLASLLCPHK